MWGLLYFVFIVFMLPMGVAALAGLLVAVSPMQMRRARTCATRYPINAGAVGLLTLAAAAVVTWLWGISTVLVVPICLLPLIVIGWIALGGGLFLGWVAVAETVGRMILARLRIYDTPMVAAVCGAFALMSGFALLSFIPCVNGLAAFLNFLLAAIGLGAFILTRAGSRGYPAATLHRVETA